MRVGIFTRIGVVLAAGLMASTPTSSSAQMNPELGDVGYDQGAGGQMGGTADQGYGGQPADTGGYDASMQGQSTGWDQSASGAPAAGGGAMGGSTGFDTATPAADAPAADPGGSDHAKVAGRLGFGFFGTLRVPIMFCDGIPAGCTPDATSVSAPTVGARYWMDEGMGLDVALGLRIASGETTTDTGMGLPPSAVVEPSVTALALHGGLPIALAHSGHFVFELVPELNFAFASGSYADAVVGDWSISGLLIEVGAKLGAEIHFGFIDLPNLSLQGTIGLGLRMESRGAEQTNAMTGGTTKIENSHTEIGTSVDGEPWDIFTGSITAIYYL